MPDSGASGVPIARTEFTAFTSEETWGVIGQLYTQVRPSPGDGTTAVARSWDTPGLALDTLRIPGAAAAESDGMSQLLLVSWLGGNGSVDFHGVDEMQFGPGDCYVVIPQTRYSFAWDSLDAVTFRLPLDVFDRAACELTGVEAGALRFSSARPLSPHAARYWTRTADRVRRSFTTPGEVAQPLIHRELINSLAAAALSVFPSTSMTRGYVPGPGYAGAAVVRRAVAYIDAHASLPITLTDIADAAGTSPQGVLAAFDRHLDTTPTAYRHRARLEGAHRDLEAADPTRGTTVAEIAARWGFAHPGRFETEYRQVHGCSPGDTLRT